MKQLWWPMKQMLKKQLVYGDKNNLQTDKLTSNGEK
jgi:hypothetical protein